MIQRIDVGRRMPEASLHNGIVHLAGQADPAGKVEIVATAAA